MIALLLALLLTPHLVIVDTGYSGTDPTIAVHAVRGDGSDEHGHGTRMADAARNACPDCRITVLDVTTDGLAAHNQIAAALELAVTLHADAVAVPFAYPERPYDTTVERIAAVAAVLPVSAAAGNSATTVPHWPAAVDGVAAVGSGRPLSNTGPWVDVVHPATSTSEASVLHAVEVAQTAPPRHYVRPRS